MEFKPYAYQKEATKWILEHKRCALFLDMGLGKTVSTLMAIRELIYDRFEVQKVLVIAPLRVAQTTWTDEISKWDNVSDLRVSQILGPARQRTAAVESEADIYIVNRENVKWLIQNHPWTYDMVVIDELSSFKSTKAERFRQLRKVIRRADRVVGLTGTPAPNGLSDLWPEIYLLDQGERLGRTLSNYRSRWFVPGRRNGAIVYEYNPIPTAKGDIYKAIGDICMSMKKEDYLDMPDLVYSNVSVQMPPAAVDKYHEMEKNMIIQLGDDPIVAVNAASVSNKLQQLSNGSVYLDDLGKAFEPIHRAKLDALEELIEEANGSPVLVFYSYRSDRARIMMGVDGCEELKTAEDIARWNRGEIKVLVAHPASIGHGLNLQEGGHIVVWYGLTWSLELYQQANDRLYRQGQKNTVSVYHIVSKGTIDEAILKALSRKENGQNALMDFLKSEISSFRKQEINRIG